MELNSKSKQSDAVGDLYRSALFMVKGQTDLSLTFLKKAQLVLNEKMSVPLLENLTKEKITKDNQSLWAEKILDQYCRLKTAFNSSNY